MAYANSFNYCYPKPQPYFEHKQEEIWLKRLKLVLFLFFISFVKPILRGFALFFLSEYHKKTSLLVGNYSNQMKLIKSAFSLISSTGTSVSVVSYSGSTNFSRPSYSRSCSSFMCCLISASNFISTPHS